MIFYLVSYDASYCENFEMQRILNAQKIHIESIFEIFIFFLRLKFD